MKKLVRLGMFSWEHSGASLDLAGPGGEHGHRPWVSFRTATQRDAHRQFRNQRGINAAGPGAAFVLADVWGQLTRQSKDDVLLALSTLGAGKILDGVSAGVRLGNTIAGRANDHGSRSWN